MIIIASKKKLNNPLYCISMKWKYIMADYSIVQILEMHNRPNAFLD